MATNKKSKKKKQPQAPVVSLKPENLLVKKGRSMPIYECRVHEGWSERGNAQVAVARRMSNGNLVIGIYLVDLWCLGLKDTFFRANVSIPEYEHMMGLSSVKVDMEKVEPALAFNMIYAAIEYAEDIGFEPAKDFKYTQYLLPEPDDFEYIEIETGKDGKPFYFSGPNDKVQAILQKLEKKLGAGNYEFMMEIDGDVEYDDEYDDDYDSGSAPNLRRMIAADFFPDWKVDRKVEGLDDEDKTDFMLQVLAVSMALEEAEGSIETLKEVYDESFLEDLTEDFMDKIDEMKALDKLPQLERTDEIYNEFSKFLNLILSRVLRNGSVDFMFKDRYRPTPSAYSGEEIKTMSQEEISEFMKDTFNMVSSEEKNYAFARMQAFNVLDEMYPVGIDEPLSQDAVEQVVKKAWEKLKPHDEEGFFDENDADVVQKFRENVLEVVDAFLKEI